MVVTFSKECHILHLRQLFARSCLLSVTLFFFDMRKEVLVCHIVQRLWLFKANLHQHCLILSHLVCIFLMLCCKLLWSDYHTDFDPWVCLWSLAYWSTFPNPKKFLEQNPRKPPYSKLKVSQNTNIAYPMSHPMILNQSNPCWGFSCKKPLPLCFIKKKKVPKCFLLHLIILCCFLNCSNSGEIGNCKNIYSSTLTWLPQLHIRNSSWRS